MARTAAAAAAAVREMSGPFRTRVAAVRPAVPAIPTEQAAAAVATVASASAATGAAVAEIGRDLGALLPGVGQLHPSMHILAGDATLKLSHRQRLYRALERPHSSRLAKCILIILVASIITSIIVFFISSIDGMKVHPVIVGLEYT